MRVCVYEFGSGFGVSEAHEARFTKGFRFDEVSWLSNSGFKCCIYIASVVLMSVCALTLRSIVNSCSVEGWSSACECDLAGEKHG